MKVFLYPPKHMSLAMFRVASVLEDTAPPGVEIVRTENEADLLILHVIGVDAVNYRPDKKVAVIQYCVNSGSDVFNWWLPLWQRAAVVWSYYDLRQWIGDNFYHAPLGVAEVFTDPIPVVDRNFGVLTSGYVTGPGAEAIEEMVVAAERAGRTSVHLGPRPVGMHEGVLCNSTGLISDQKLKYLYQHTNYVSGLRYVEGFELPALEGLACGARPIMFDRPDAHNWFHEHAEFVPECHGEELIGHLVKILSRDPKPINIEERAWVLERFNWDQIANEFWKMLLEGVERA